jgi:hypothetical protein
MLIRTAFLLSLCLLPSFARASGIDFKDTSCSAYLSKIEALSKNNMPSVALILTWMYGYASGVSGGSTFEDAQFQKFAAALDAFCRKNPGEMVLTGARKTVPN